MTELTILLSPSSTPVTGVVDDIQPVALTLTLVNNDSAAADVSGGLMAEFTADPGVKTTDGTNGPVKALLASNFTADPSVANPDGTLPPVTLLGPGVSASPAADTNWTIDSGSLEGAILVFTATPNGNAQYTLQPGTSITFIFTGVAVDTIPGASAVMVSVLPSIQGGTAATIGAQPQIQKTSVSLQPPTVTANPPVIDPPAGQARLTPPASQAQLTWSNNGAGSCELDWNNNSTVVTSNGAVQNSGWKAPLIVADPAAIATLLETDTFTVKAYGTGSDGTSADTKSTPVNVTLNPPEFAAITVPPVVTGVWPPVGDRAGGQQITVTGVGLAAASAVTLTPVGAPAGAKGNSATSFTVVSDTEVTVFTPQGTGLFDVTIKTPVGTSPVVPEDIYAYAAAGTPVVTGVSPTYGGVDGTDQVTITGTGLAQASTVDFGASSVSITAANVVSDSTLTVPSPAGAGVVDITVTAGSVTSPATPAGRYTYLQPTAPIVTGVGLTDPAPQGVTPPTRPPTGGDPAGGQLVTITGTGLTHARAVTFIPLGAGPSTSATGITVNSDTQVTAITPPGSGVADIIITADGQASPATPADRFGYGIQAEKAVPHQPFQLIWSCYQGWNRDLSWQFTGDSAHAPNDPDTVSITGDTTSDCGRAIVSINRAVTFTLTLPPGTQTLANLPVSMAPVELTGFASTAPAWNPETGAQTVTLSWNAANVVGFSLTQNGTSLQQQPTYDQRDYELSLPLSGPVTYALTAYGYDTTGTLATQITQSVTVTPNAVALSYFNVSLPNVSPTGQQSVAVSWQVANATAVHVTAPTGDVTPGPPTGSTSVLLPPPGTPPQPAAYPVTLAADGFQSRSWVEQVTPVQVGGLVFNVTPLSIMAGDTVALSWSATAATRFEVDGNYYSASTRELAVKLWITTTLTLIAEGYTTGKQFPSSAPVTVEVTSKGKDHKDGKDKVHGHEDPAPRVLPPRPADPVPAEPPGGGKQPLITEHERPEVGGSLRGGGSGSPVPPPPSPERDE